MIHIEYFLICFIFAVGGVGRKLLEIKMGNRMGINSCWLLLYFKIRNKCERRKMGFGEDLQRDSNVHCYLFKR